MVVLIMIKLEEFKNYVLTDANLSEGTARSYVSSIRSILKKEGVDLKEFLNSSNDKETTIINDIVSNYAKKISECSDKKIRHRLTDLNSALICFLNFLSSKATNSVVNVSTIKTEQFFSREELIKIFLARIKTQDRFYGDYCLPFRIFSRIFPKDGDFLNALKSLLKRVKFIISDKGKTITLFEIDGLIIKTNGTVFVKCGNNQYQVYTQSFTNGISNGLTEMVVNSIADVSLDHDVPLFEKKDRMKELFPEITKLSDDVLKFIKKLKYSHPASMAGQIAKDYFENQYSSLIIDKKELLKELIEFFNITSITAMDKKSNSSKNKNI